MKISKEKADEMLEKAKPLIEWLNDNCHPHCDIVVTHLSAELKEGVSIVRTEEFLNG